MKFDLILLCIYPIYRILCLCPFEFIYSLHKFSTLFLLMFVIEVIFSFANNKLKEIILALAILAVIFVVNVFMGSFDGIVYAVIYGFIAYQIYRLMNANGIKETGESRKCPKCGNTVAEDEAFCTACGEKME